MDRVGYESMKASLEAARDGRDNRIRTTSMDFQKRDSMRTVHRAKVLQMSLATYKRKVDTGDWTTMPSGYSSNEKETT